MVNRAAGRGVPKHIRCTGENRGCRRCRRPSHCCPVGANPVRMCPVHCPCRKVVSGILSVHLQEPSTPGSIHCREPVHDDPAIVCAAYYMVCNKLEHDGCKQATNQQQQWRSSKHGITKSGKEAPAAHKQLASIVEQGQQLT